jgi:hypothetical protein
VTSLFDPFDPVGSMGRLWSRGQRDAQSWFEQWADATSAWTSAVPTPERLLGQLIDGLFARFGGGRITLAVHGDEISGVLEVLRVTGPAGDHRALAILTAVAWRGRRIDEVIVRASDVRINPGLTSTLTASFVEIEGRATIAEALAFADASNLEWRPRLDAAGQLRAVHRDRPVRITGIPTAKDDRLEVGIVALGYGDVGFRLPAWMRLVRHVDLTLPAGTHLVDAHRVGDDVSFRVVLDDVRYELDLDRVRTAIVRGATVPLA